MSTVTCSQCDNEIAMHELEAKTVAQREGFETRYRCPFCRSDVGDLLDTLA